MISDAIIDGMSVGLHEGSLNVYNIINVDGFLARLATWVHENVPSPDDVFVEQGEWTVILSINADSERIDWVAKQGRTGPYERGAMWPSYDDLRKLGQETACEEVRRLFEIEVIPRF